MYYSVIYYFAGILSNTKVLDRCSRDWVLTLSEWLLHEPFTFALILNQRNFSIPSFLQIPRWCTFVRLLSLVRYLFLFINRRRGYSSFDKVRGNVDVRSEGRHYIEGMMGTMNYA